MFPLLPSGVQTQVHLLVPSRKFDLSYDLNFATICNDFQENIEFQFSLGWKALVHRFLGSVNAQRALKLMEQNLQSQVWGILHDSDGCSHSANNKTFTRKPTFLMMRQLCYCSVYPGNHAILWPLLHSGPIQQ